MGSYEQNAEHKPRGVLAGKGKLSEALHSPLPKKNRKTYFFSYNQRSSTLHLSPEKCNIQKQENPITIIL
jgi:hypothetical protein